MIKAGERLPRDKPGYFDKGYQGAKKDYPELKLFIPQKANRWHKLTEKDKVQNTALNKIRIKVKHSILKCKRFKILAQTYRKSLKSWGTGNSVFSSLYYALSLIYHLILYHTIKENGIKEIHKFPS